MMLMCPHLVPDAVNKNIMMKRTVSMVMSQQTQSCCLSKNLGARENPCSKWQQQQAINTHCLALSHSQHNRIPLLCIEVGDAIVQRMLFL